MFSKLKLHWNCVYTLETGCESNRCFSVRYTFVIYEAHPISFFLIFCNISILCVYNVHYITILSF